MRRSILANIAEERIRLTIRNISVLTRIEFWLSREENRMSKE